MSLLVLMGVKKEDPVKIYCSVAIGSLLVEGERSNLVAAVEGDYGFPHAAGEELASRLVTSGVQLGNRTYVNGWYANGVFSQLEQVSGAVMDGFKRRFEETLKRLQYSLDRRP